MAFDFPLLTLFLKSLAIVPLTLLPIINPIGNAPIFMSMTGGSDFIAKRMARQVTVNCFFILMASMLIGTYVLELFGISLPIVRIGGGLLVAATGWRLLNDGGHDGVRNAVADKANEISQQEIVRRSFFPMSFPLTAGPGTIAACIALGTKLPSTPAKYLLGVGVAMLGAAITVGVVYLCYRNAALMLAKLGEVGTLVMMRLVAFILLCIGIEIIWTGWAELNHIAP